MTVDDRLDLAIALGWNDGGDASGLQVGKNEVGIVTLVGSQDARLWARFSHDRRIALHIRDLPAAQRDRGGEAKSVAAEMDFGREATTRAAKTLVRIPLLSAPAA